MVENLIIVGAGGFSGSIAAAVEDINRWERRWNLLGFIDDDPARRGQQPFGYPILDVVSSASPYSTCRFVIGVASHRNRRARHAIVERMGLPIEHFATIVHPTVSVHATASLGPGTVILQGTVVNHGVSVGNHTLVSEQCSLGHDSAIGDFATIAPGAIVSGCAKIGAGAYLGAGSRILENLTIGDYALVGIGGVVVRDVAENVTVFGNPARPLRSASHVDL